MLLNEDLKKYCKIHKYYLLAEMGADTAENTLNCTEKFGEV